VQPPRLHALNILELVIIASGVPFTAWGRRAFAAEAQNVLLPRCCTLGG
jgi:hypothetical protein